MKPLRSESYRRWIAAQPCINCGVDGYSQAAHPNGGGMGTKADDLLCFPLCCDRPGVNGCHGIFDLCIGITKAGRRELTAVYSQTMQRAARAAGRKEFEVTA